MNTSCKQLIDLAVSATVYGYIYFRDNDWYSRENVIKMGITENIIDRDGTYITGEVFRGNYPKVIQVPLHSLPILDRCLKHYFQSYNVYKMGGTEFYQKCVMDLVDEYLNKTNIDFHILSQDEINTIERTQRVRKTIKKIKKTSKLDVTKFIGKLRKNKKNIKNEKNKKVETLQAVIYKEPNAQQKYVLSTIEQFYQENDIGKLIWACGLGKALLSILIVQKMNYKKVIIGVPSKPLQDQIKDEILKIFPNKTNILFVGGDKNKDISTTTNLDVIKKFLENTNEQPKFIVTTYHSCHYIVDDSVLCDFKIGDEAHHLVGIETEEKKGFRKFHKIQSTKSLFMTATEKVDESRTASYSMDDERVFGKCIDTKTVSWAINNKKITDYMMVTLKTDEQVVDDIISYYGIKVTNKQIFISAFMALKSPEKYNTLTHILLYTNTIEDAELAKQYIDQLLELNILNTIEKDDVYNNVLHSDSSCDVKEELTIFKSKKYGIISCVYIFGEGFDLPKLNGVCIAANMQSEIRIVQYLLRPNRLEIGNPNKIAYVILPYIDSDEWENSYKTASELKLKNIVSQLRNVDENIEQKIRASILQKRREQGKINETRCDSYDEFYCVEDECANELNKIKLRLRHSKSLRSNYSEEQDEYNYVREINRSLNIQSPEEYESKEGIHPHFIKSPEDYFKARGVWTNWYDFMGVDTKKFIHSKVEWINFCKEKKVSSASDYFEKCKFYSVLPSHPVWLYTDFTNIPNELGFYTQRRR